MRSNYEETRFSQIRQESTDEPRSTSYQSAISTRSINVQRPRAIGLPSNGVATRIQQSFISTNSGYSFGPGLAALAQISGVPIRSGSVSASTAVVHINENRQRDKRDLAILNDKFAQYVEKVRYLEAQNRKLNLELEALSSRSGQSSSRIKDMYDIEMAEANKIIAETKRDGALANEKAAQAEGNLKRQRARYEELSNLRVAEQRDIDSIQRQIAENEAQISLYRRRIADLDDECRIFKNESQRLSSEIFHIQNEIQNESLLKSSLEFEKLALEEELVSLEQQHEVDLAELRAKTMSTDLDPSKFFRNELAQSIREIRQDYETCVDKQRTELNNRYSLLVQEVVIHNQRPEGNLPYSERYYREHEQIRTDLSIAQNQNAYLRAKTQQVKNAIGDLQQKLKKLEEQENFGRARHEKDMADATNHLAHVEENYDRVLAFKTSLEKEIGTYRDYLESPSGLRGCVDRIVRNAEQKSYDQSSGNVPSNANRGSSATTTTKTVSHTYVNKTTSNYTYRNTPTGSTIANLTSQPTVVQSQSQNSSTYYMTPTENPEAKRSSLRSNLSRSSTNQSEDNTGYIYMSRNGGPQRSTSADVTSPTRTNLSEDHTYDEVPPASEYHEIGDAYSVDE